MGGEVTRSALEKAIRKRVAVGGKASEGQLAVSAEVVRAALLATEEPGSYGVLWLRNVRIEGVLDLRDLELRTRLRLHGCEFDERVQFDQLEADNVELLDCHLPKGMAANQVTINRNLKLDRSEMGPVALRGAKINGYLSFEGTRIRRSGNGEAEGLPALNMEAAEIATGIYCGKIISEGEILMTGAKVGHRLSLNDATLKAEKGEGFALKADGVEIRGSLICHEAEIEGDFRLPRAEIHSQLSLSNSSLTGELNMLGASIRGELALIGAKFVNPAGRTIKGDRMQIGGGIHCGGKFESAGLGEIGETRQPSSQAGLQGR